MRRSLIFIILLFGKISFAQITYSGSIIDATTNLPIENVSLKVKDSKKGTVTDINGAFEIEKLQTPATIIISHLNYQEEEKTINFQINVKEVIYLLPKINLLNEITVFPEEQAESISNVKEYSVRDYEILDDKIYRLEYHGVFEKYLLSVTDLSGKVESTIKLKSIKRVQQLHKSCTNTIYVLSAKNAYTIAGGENKLSLNSKIGIDTFNNFIKPCQLKKGSTLYYIHKSLNDLESKITTYDMTTNQLNTLRIISNKQQVENYKQDLGFINLSQSIGNITTTDTGENKKIRDIQKKGDFMILVFYKPEFPVFLISQGEKVLLFNHIEKKIEKYTDDQLESEVPINYVLDKEWLKEIKIDSVTEKVYGIFESTKGIKIKEIDTETGQTHFVGILETAIQNYKTISIYNNSVYYLKEKRVGEPIMELFRYRM